VVREVGKRGAERHHRLEHLVDPHRLIAEARRGRRTWWGCTSSRRSPMPLLEVIRGGAPGRSGGDGGRAGEEDRKTVIVVNDGPGFYTSRILAPYVNEAAFMSNNGAAVEDIDRGWWTRLSVGR